MAITVNCEREVRVIIASSRSIDKLRDTIESLSISAAKKLININVTIVLNGIKSKPISHDKLKFKRIKLNIITCNIAGKNHALNIAIDQSEESVLICLDDDIIVCIDYLGSVFDALQRWPNAAMYFGPLKLIDPDGVIDKIDKQLFDYVRGFAFAELNSDNKMGPSERNPLGGNMILRKALLPSTKPFNPEVGPMPGVYRMGGAEMLFRDLRKRGREFIYVPDAIGFHKIRQEQSSIKWIRSRSFMYGRSIFYHGLKFRTINGSSGYLHLFYQYILRVMRMLVFYWKSPNYPYLWAVIEKEIITGAMFEARISAIRGIRKFFKI